MKTSLALLGAAILISGTAGIAKDEPYLSATHKILGHRAQTSQQHAQDQAQTLYYYSQSQQPVPKQEAKELVAGIRRDLAASQKALAALKAEYAKNKEAIDLIESIKTHHAKAFELCGMTEEACEKEEGDKVVIGDCCSEMWYELEAARTETQKLLKMLKIDKFEPPKKVGVKPGSPKKTDARN
ncbi:MAG: hypothetical protein ACM3U2_21765 [Deltaproteobacteria bacterium]